MFDTINNDYKKNKLSKITNVVFFVTNQNASVSQSNNDTVYYPQILKDIKYFDKFDIFKDLKENDIKIEELKDLGNISDEIILKLIGGNNKFKAKYLENYKSVHLVLTGGIKQITNAIRICVNWHKPSSDIYNWHLPTDLTLLPYRTSILDILETTSLLKNMLDFTQNYHYDSALKLQESIQIPRSQDSIYNIKSLLQYTHARLQFNFKDSNDLYNKYKDDWDPNKKGNLEVPLNDNIDNKSIRLKLVELYYNLQIKKEQKRSCRLFRSFD